MFNSEFLFYQKMFYKEENVIKKKGYTEICVRLFCDNWFCIYSNFRCDKFLNTFWSHCICMSAVYSLQLLFWDLSFPIPSRTRGSSSDVLFILPWPMFSSFTGLFRETVNVVYNQWFSNTPALFYFTYLHSIPPTLVTCFPTFGIFSLTQHFPWEDPWSTEHVEILNYSNRMSCDQVHP